MPEEPPSEIQVSLHHFSRWRSLKQYLPALLWFIAGAVLAEVYEIFVFPLWLNHAVKSIARWVDSLVADAMVKHWIFFSAFDLISWLMAILAGVLGGLVIKRHLLRDLCSLGTGFALVPLLLYAYDEFAIPSWNLITDQGFVILLTVCSGMLAHYLKGRFLRKSPPAQ